MFGAPSARMGRIFGIPVEVNATWLVVFVLVAMSLSFNYYPSAFPGRPLSVDVASGIITALLFFVSIIFHETSHALVARAGGIQIEKVTLFMFGGVAQMRDEPATPGREFVMAIAGPLASVLLSALFAVIAVIMYFTGVSNVFWGPFEYLAVINVSVALFNMLPGFPLDGGRVLRAALWKVTGDLLRATRWASAMGQFIGYSLIALSVFGVLRGSLNMIWLGLVGWFISVLADSAYRQQAMRGALHKRTIASIASPNVMVVPGDITVEQLVFDHFVGGPHTRYPVVKRGEVIGLVTLDAAKSIPRDQWASTSVESITWKDLASLVVDADWTAEGLLDRFLPGSPGALVVKRDGRLAGIVTRADLTKHLRRAGLEG